MLIARIPAPPVRAFVSALWHAEGWRPEHPRERIMPDGTANLIIALDDREGSAGEPIMNGPRSGSAILRSAGIARSIIGAHFTPGGVAAVSDMPLSEIRDRHVSLADLVGPAVTELRERLLQAATAGQRLDVLESWLGARMRGRRGADPAILWAARQLARPLARVSNVAESIGYSGRWLAATFERDIGLTPKLFNRVQRFHGALRLARKHACPDLADLAAAAGYYDQAHLTHEFGRLAGMSPSVLLAARTEHINHIAVRSEERGVPSRRRGA